MAEAPIEEEVDKEGGRSVVQQRRTKRVTIQRQNGREAKWPRHPSRKRR